MQIAISFENMSLNIAVISYIFTSTSQYTIAKGTLLRKNAETITNHKNLFSLNKLNFIKIFTQLKEILLYCGETTAVR